MKVLFAASEATGFAKTGGLADVIASLPRALAERGHDCTIMLPLYAAVRRAWEHLELLPYRFEVSFPGRKVPGRLFRATLPHSNVRVILIEQPGYFERDDPARGTGIYQFTLPNGQKIDYADNCERFVFFCRSVLEAARLLHFEPDVIHAHDWQTGLVPVYLREEFGPRSFPNTRCLFTIHNIAYQGLFWMWDMNLTGLDWRLFNSQQLEFYRQVSFLKGGIVFANLVNTVSPTYAREIQTPDFGCGLEGVLTAHRQRLFGIPNGADYSVWNPAIDQLLPIQYDMGTVAEGKRTCKATLQHDLKLPVDLAIPLVGMVARLVPQKGTELVLRVADQLLQQGAQLVVLGEGDPGIERQLEQVRSRYPDRMALFLGFDERLAHRIEAAADLFLMPSKYEPMGLNQLYSMKYGTPVVARTTGGLADTVIDASPHTLANGTATGFTFGPFSIEALWDALRRGLEMYRHQPDQWQALTHCCMRQDWSWNRSAAEYEKLYQALWQQ
jgi:starch synthase